MSRIQAADVLPLKSTASTYFVLDYLPFTLDSYACQYVACVIPLPRIQSLLRQILSALDHVYMHRLVHSDLKPANILVDAMGNLSLCEFGMARPTGTAGERQLVTLLYCSPEILRGQSKYT
jgi:serine/threonine protein kinase